MLDWIAASDSEFEVFRQALKDVLAVCVEIAQCDTSDDAMDSLLSTMVGVLVPFLEVMGQQGRLKAMALELVI